MDSPVIVDKASEFGEPIDLDRPFPVSGAIFFFAIPIVYFAVHNTYVFITTGTNIRFLTCTVKINGRYTLFLFVDISMSRYYTITRSLLERTLKYQTRIM